MKSIISVKVRYPETDRMGIVYHANYYPWFELGRLDFIEKCKASYADMEKAGLLMPVTETHCRYLKPCVFGDEVTVETVLTQLTVARCRFEYRILNKGEVAAQGSTGHAFADENLHAINIRKRFPEIWNTLTFAMKESNL